MRMFLQRAFALLRKLRFTFAVLVTLFVTAAFVFRAVRLGCLPDIGDPFDVSQVDTVDVDPANNAFPGYQRASALLVPGNQEGLEAALQDGWGGADPDLRKWVEDNHPALTQFLSASAAGESVLIQPSELVPDAFSLVVLLREFTKLSRIEASRQIDQGDLASAWETLLAALRASRHCGMHGDVTERIIGIGLHKATVEGMIPWSQHPDATAAQLRQALRDVRSAFKLTSATHVMLQLEYVRLQAMLRDPEALRQQVEGTQTGKLVEDLGPTGLYFVGEPEFSRRMLQHMFANYLGQCDRPWTSRTPIHEKLYEPDPSLPARSTQLRPDDMRSQYYSLTFANWIIPAVGAAIRNVDVERARQGELELVLALQAYFRDHGEFPENSAAVISDDLPNLPDDPFARPGTSLNYQREAGHARLWSIGPDGINDAGRV